MRICIINTGGTISCVGQPLAPMPSARFAAAAEDLLGPALRAALPGTALHFDSGLRFPDGHPDEAGPGMLDSTDLRPSDWCRMAGRVLALYGDHDAFVILHGTDTMDYSGAALPLLLNVFDETGLATAALSKPVILTGAQLPLFRETAAGLVLNAGSDGLANLTGALDCARLGLPEVAIFFDGRLMRANRALKVSTTRFAGFDSPHLPPLAHRGIGLHHGPARPLPGPAAPDRALDDPAARARAVAQLDAVAARIDAQRVVQIPAVPADHCAPAPLLAGMIGAALDGGATGLLIEGFGAGNVPAGSGAMAAALSDARDRGVPVLIASRAHAGQVGAFDYAAGAWIAATGAQAVGDMTPVAALAKLMVLSAAAPRHGWTAAVLSALMVRSLAGECAVADRMDDTLMPGASLRAADGAALLMNDPDHGPQLTAGGRPLWQAPGPGRMVLRDGRLMLIARDGAVIWTSAASVPGAVAVLTAEPAGLRLIDPAGRVAPVTALPLP